MKTRILSILMGSLIFVLGSTTVYANETVGQIEDEIVEDSTEITDDDYTEEQAEAESVLDEDDLDLLKDDSGYLYATEEEIASDEIVEDEGASSFSLEYDEDSSSATAFVSGYSGNISGQLIIPNKSPNNFDVIGIGRSVFTDCKDITSVSFPNTLKYIKSNAFKGCSNLKSLAIPDSVETIEMCAFRFCKSLESVSLPDKITELEYDAFSDCYKLKSVKLPAQLEVIGECAFMSCQSLESIKIPVNVNSIGMEAFADCKALAKIEVDDGNVYYDSRNSCNAIIRKDTKTLIVGCKNTVIPNGVEVIDEAAFESCKELTRINFPVGLKEIKKYAFVDCASLKGVSFPSTLKTIGEGAFSECGSLTSVVIPGTVSTVETIAFAGCGKLADVTLENGITTLGDAVFSVNNSLEKIVIPSSVQTILEDAECFFEECNGLKYVVNNSNCVIPLPEVAGHYWTKKGDSTHITQIRFGIACRDDYNSSTKYSVSFNSNGGTAVAPIKDIVKGKKISKPADPQKKGYTFSGWYKESSLASKWDFDKDSVEKNITLYAKWKKNTYTISYKLNGGKNNSKNPKNYTVTSSTIALQKPTRKGYTFKGWYTDKKLTKKITEIKKGSTGNKTVYAKWTANKYTIKFNANGGKGKMNNKSMTYDKKAKLTKNSYTRKGYTFQGWSTDKKAKKATYKNKAEVKNLSSKNGATVTLYAVWKKK